MNRALSGWHAEQERGRPARVVHGIAKVDNVQLRPISFQLAACRRILNWFCTRVPNPCKETTYMAQDMNKLIDKLNDLIALDYDAARAYESAIQRMNAVNLIRQLRTFQVDHERHIQELGGVVKALGGKPRAGPDIKGFLIQGFTAITSEMGDEAALKAMRGNEKLATKTYGDALAETWPEDIRQLIERNHADEQRHLAFIEESLRLRSWEQDTAHP
jgi:uncharacterized protein (TIGR02284 family)